MTNENDNKITSENDLIIIFQEYLIKECKYPKENIIPHYNFNNAVYDLAITAGRSKVPIKIFEFKFFQNTLFNQNKNIISTNEISYFKIIYKYNKNINFYIVDLDNKTSNSSINFRIYDITDAVNGKTNINYINNNISKYLIVIPVYSITSDKENAKSFFRNNKKRNSIAIKILCWGVIPVIIISLCLLNFLKKIELTVPIVSLLGFSIVLVLFPLTKEIKFNDISLSMEDEDNL